MLDRAAVVFVATVLVGCSSAERPAAKPGDGRGGIKLSRVGSFERPTHVEDAPGEKDLLFIVEQPGTVRVVKQGKSVGTFLDIESLVADGGERGLLSIAFAPDYQKTRRFYVYYTDNAGAIQIDRFKRSRKSRLRANRGSRKGVIRIPHPGASNHNGGQLQFDHKDNLFIGTGDGGGANDQFDNARKTSSLLGKLLRVRPKARGGYSIPKTNPFRSGAGRDEIFSIGLRNPWRFSFDRANPRRIVIADVGQNEWEEINYVKLGRARGGNFGWPTFEGSHSFDPDRRGPGNPIGPISEYSHDRGCSITGGFIVRDRKLRSLRGRYLYTDVCNGELRSLVPRLGGAKDEKALGLSVDRPTSFGEGRGGRIYVASQAGPVFRLKPR